MIVINNRSLFTTASEGNTISEACQNMGDKLINGHTYQAQLNYLPSQAELEMLVAHQVTVITIKLEQ